jgi:Fe-S-cluster containining protein
VAQAAKPAAKPAEPRVVSAFPAVYNGDVPPVEVKFRLAAPDRSIEASIRLPREPVRPRDLVPAILDVAGAVVGMSESRVAEDGEVVSCRAGCGACCRQLVPVSEPEALHLASLVEAMPEPRRSQIVERFQAARRRSAAVLDAVHSASGEAVGVEMTKAGEPYFRLGIPCPFLEQESCGIHPQRPSICREYLVTSTPEHCASLDADRIKRVPVPVTVSSALMYFSDGRGTEDARVRPLIEALDWAAELSGQPEPRIPAPEMFRNFLRQFAGDGRPARPLPPRGATS